MDKTASMTLLAAVMSAVGIAEPLRDGLHCDGDLLHHFAVAIRMRSAFHFLGAKTHTKAAMAGGIQENGASL